MPILHSFLSYKWIHLSSLSFSQALCGAATYRISEIALAYMTQDLQTAVFWAGSCDPSRVPWVLSDGTRHLCLSNRPPSLNSHCRHGHCGYFFLLLLFFNNLFQIWESGAKCSLRCHCEKLSIDSVPLLDLWPCFLCTSRRDAKQWANVLK